MKKFANILMFSAVFVSFSYAGDISSVADAAKSLGSFSGNAAVGINAEKGDANIKAEAAGSGSNANAGLAVIDASSGGKTGNMAIAYNSGIAKIEAQAKSGGTANSGLVVIKSK
jgi:hypothetical protein